MGNAVVEQSDARTRERWIELRYDVRFREALGKLETRAAPTASGWSHGGCCTSIPAEAAGIRRPPASKLRIGNMPPCGIGATRPSANPVASPHKAHEAPALPGLSW